MQRVYLTVMAALVSVLTMAQDKSVDINIKKDGGGGGIAPWMWVVGAAVFILLLVALLRGRSTSKE